MQSASLTKVAYAGAMNAKAAMSAANAKKERTAQT